MLDENNEDDISDDEIFRDVDQADGIHIIIVTVCVEYYFAGNFEIILLCRDCNFWVWACTAHELLPAI